MKTYSEIFDMNNYPRFDGKHRPKDTGPCICLSGKVYKECCKDKIEESKKNKDNIGIDDGLNSLYGRKYSKLTSRKVYKKDIIKKNFSYCLACNIYGNCSKDSIRYTHTLSKGVVLKNLCNGDNNYVKQIDDYIMINDTNKKFDERFNDVDVDKASITVSFCKTHDELLFEDIEKDGCKEYVQSEIQNLEYALKAITFEIYDIAFEIDYLAELVKENVDVVYDSPNYSRYFEDYEIKLSLMEPYLELANRLIYDIKQMKESGVSSKLVTKCISLKYNRVEYSLSEIIDGCLVNVINASKPYIIISFYPDKKYGDQEICELVENYLKKPERKNLKRITEHIISNSKNIYFNKKTIEHLNKKALSNLYWAHRNGIGDNRVSNNFGDIMMKVFYK